eukprot:gene7539-9270_t
MNRKSILLTILVLFAFSTLIVSAGKSKSVYLCRDCLDRERCYKNPLCQPLKLKECRPVTDCGGGESHAIVNVFVDKNGKNPMAHIYEFPTYGCTGTTFTTEILPWPYGRDKLIVDRDNRYLTTNDGATILRYLEITHPATRLLIGIAKSQDDTVGDGTTSVGYQIGLSWSLEIIDSLKISCTSSNSNDTTSSGESILNDSKFKEYLKSVASTSISSKILGRYSEHFTQLGVDCIMKLGRNKSQDLIRVLTINGNSMLESKLIDGILLEYKYSNNNNHNGNQIKNNSYLKTPKVIVGKLQLNSIQSEIIGTKLLFNQKSDQWYYQENEKQLYREKLSPIINTGINVVISDTELPSIVENIFSEFNIQYFCIQDSRELEIISYCLGSKFLYGISGGDGGKNGLLDETMYSCPRLSSIVVIGDRSFLQLTGIESSVAGTVLIRSSTETLSQECIRSFKDMLNILSFTVNNPYMIGGGGCLYIEIAQRIRDRIKLSSSIIKDEKIQLSLNAFTESLETIPMILAQNAGYDAISLISKLKEIHNGVNNKYNNNNNNGVGNEWMGINLNDGTIVNMLEFGVTEPSFLLTNILTLASRAAQMILRINNNIILEPRQQFKPPSLNQ